LAALEERLLHECNELGIGPMGFGGKTTVLGVKIGTCHRLPASYFVSIAYMCWACRRARMLVRNGKVEYS
jgi:fumarate hydratase class I